MWLRRCTMRTSFPYQTFLSTGKISFLPSPLWPQIPIEMVQGNSMQLHLCGSLIHLCTVSATSMSSAPLKYLDSHPMSPSRNNKNRIQISLLSNFPIPRRKGHWWISFLASSPSYPLSTWGHIFQDLALATAEREDINYVLGQDPDSDRFAGAEREYVV